MVQRLEQAHLQLIARNGQREDRVARRVHAQHLSGRRARAHLQVDGPAAGGHQVGRHRRRRARASNQLQAQGAATGQRAAVGPGRGRDREQAAQPAHDGRGLACNETGRVVVDRQVRGFARRVAVHRPLGLIQVQRQGRRRARVGSDRQGRAVVLEADAQRIGAGDAVAVTVLVGDGLRHADGRRTAQAQAVVPRRSRAAVYGVLQRRVLRHCHLARARVDRDREGFGAASGVPVGPALELGVADLDKLDLVARHGGVGSCQVQPGGRSRGGAELVGDGVGRRRTVLAEVRGLKQPADVGRRDGDAVEPAGLVQRGCRRRRAGSHFGVRTVVLDRDSDGAFVGRVHAIGNSHRQVQAGGVLASRALAWQQMADWPGQCHLIGNGAT